MSTIGHRLSLAVLASVVACADDSANEGDAGGQCLGEPTPYVDSELIEWFGFGVDFDEFCAAGVEISHDHARWVAQAWGREPESFRYGVFESVDDPCWPCSHAEGACVSNHDLASTRVPDRHELTHAAVPGSCFTLIEEGYAMLYSNHFEDAETAGDIRLALLDADTGGLSGEYYPIAARFVAFLLETRGIDQLRALCELGARDAAQFEIDVISTYGESFDDLATEFDAYPEWWVSELRQDQACESSDVLVQPAEWDFHFACGEPGVEGKLGWAFVTQRLVELPEERMYQFDFESQSEFQMEFELRSCTRDGMASILFMSDFRYIDPVYHDGLLPLEPLPAGVYVLRVRVMDPSGPVDLHVSVKPWP